MKVELYWANNVGDDAPIVINDVVKVEYIYVKEKVFVKIKTKTDEFVVNTDFLVCHRILD